MSTSWIQSVRTGDFDRDGDLDLAATGIGDIVQVILNTGHGDLALGETRSFSGGQGSEMLVGDADANGTLDLVVLSNVSFLSTSYTTYLAYLSLLRGDGTGHFTGPRQTMPGLRATIAADFDEDGAPDLLGAALGILRFARNQGEGTFGSSAIVADVLGWRQLHAADLDGDGHLDVLAMRWRIPELYVLRGRGDGTFDAPVVVHVLDVPEVSYPTFEAADMDLDGDRDIVWSDPNRVIVGWLENRGGLQFRQLEQRDLGADVQFISGAPLVFDADGDHDLDLVVSTEGTLELLRNQGGWSFSAGERIGAATNEWIFPHLTDVDLDGDTDVLAQERRAGLVRVYTNDGAGHFTPGVTFRTPYATGFITVGDLDGDSRDDVVLATTVPPAIYIVRNTTAGFVEVQRTWPSTMNSMAPCLVDLSGDGRLDIFVTGSDNTAVLLNHSLPAAHADCNGNGLPDECDLAAGTSSDVDGDATPDECAAPIATSFCSGDGTASPCPCGNFGAPGRGCANSVDPNGALLVAEGSASLADDTLEITATGVPGSTTILFQGTERDNGGMGTPLLDGLRCVGGTVVRLGSKPGVAGAARFPDEGGQRLSTRGVVLQPGVRTYQVFYRNSAIQFCPAGTGNWTNGIEVIWRA